MTSKSEKDALALVFGVMKRGSVVSGIPGFVPGLTKALTNPAYEVKLARGLPVEFSDHMSDEQKKRFRELTGYKSKSVTAVPKNPVRQTKKD